MRTLVDRRVLPVFAIALLLLPVALASTGCGSAVEAGASASSPQAAASSPATLDVAGDLLVVRRQEGAWKLVRLTPASGAEQVLGALSFKPRQALASPSGARVLYVGARSQLAVAEAATGAVQSVSLAGLPVRAIDGATWINEDQFLFGGSRTVSASPEASSLYRADVATGKVSRFRRLAGGEPSYAAAKGSLIYVTRRTVGDDAKEVIWRLRSLTASRPRVLTRDSVSVEAGRVFDAPLISPDGGWVLGAQTGTDVSVTYSLVDAGFLGETMLQLSGASPATAAWGDTKVAFLQSLPSDPDGKLAVFVYDSETCCLIPYPSPWLLSLDWSPNGDLVGGAWELDDADNATNSVYAAAASDLGTWVNLGAGLVPVWVQ